MSTLTTIISVIAGGIIAYLIARWQMKKSQIVHYYINSYDVGKGLTDDFPSFSLHYRDQTLSNNVQVLKGGFINIGRNDIGDNGKTTTIKIILPVGCVVKDVKVSTFEEGLEVKWLDNKKYTSNGNLVDSESIENGNELIFEITDLFKTKECFNYSTIIEVPDDKTNLRNLMILDHRIKDTSLEKLYLGPNYMSVKKRLSEVFWLAYSVISILSWIGVQWWGDDQIKEGSEALLITGLIIALYVAIIFIVRRWGKRGRVLHELLKKEKNFT